MACQSLDISLSLKQWTINNNFLLCFLASSAPLQGKQLVGVEWCRSQVLNRSFSVVCQISSFLIATVFKFESNIRYTEVRMVCCCQIVWTHCCWQRKSCFKSLHLSLPLPPSVCKRQARLARRQTQDRQEWGLPPRPGRQSPGFHQIWFNSILWVWNKFGQI